MTARLGRRLARALLAIACSLMPAGRAHWRVAMHNEFDYLPPAEAVRWATGCLSAALQARFEAMKTGDLHISRLVMLVETIGCFGCLALGWFEIMFGATGVVHHSTDVIQRNYLPYPGGAYVVTLLFAGAITGLIGPLGLFLGARYVMLGRALASRALTWTCIGVLLGYLILAGIGGFLYGPPDFRPSFEMAVLFSVLPIAGIAHLHWLSRPREALQPGLAI